MLPSVFAVLVLASVARPAPACPAEAIVRQELGVGAAAWQVACKAKKDGEIQLAGLVPPVAGGGPSRIVVLLRRGEELRRAELALDDLKRDGLDPFSGEAWQLAIGPAAIKGADDWLRVDVTARSGEDLRVAQTATVFLRAGLSLTPLWMGASDRHEVRFDACRVDTTARFTLSRNGDLVRARGSRRVFRDPGGVDVATLASVKAECTAPPPTRQTFPVADDGLDANITVDEPLRARARANRLLYLRASESDEAFARFVADSMALVAPLSDAVASGHPLDPAEEVVTASVSGAFAYAAEGGLRSGLDWKRFGTAAKPASRYLILALRAFDTDDNLGAWIEAMTDRGGCHSPAKAARPLAQLVTAWQAAPQSVRDAFRDHLVRRATDMTTNGCFCAPRAKLARLQQDLERNAVLLEGLSEIGPAAAQQLRALPAAAQTTFDCGGPH